MFAPKGVSLNAYKLLLQRSDVWIGYRNSIFYTVVGTCLNMIVTLPAAYALSRKELAGRRWIMLYFTFTMFFNGGMITSYILVQKLHLLNTVWSLLLPGAIGVYNLIIAKTFIQNSIPGELLEAARIDGCGEIGIFLKVVLPSQKPAVGALGIYMFMSMWNNFMWPLIILSTKSMYNFPVALAMLDGVAWRKDYGVIMLATVCAVLPIMIIFLVFQKQFVAGVMGGAVKE